MLCWHLIVYIFREVQSSQSDLTNAENRRLKSREDRLSLSVCTVCHEPFSLLFNKRLVCMQCALGVCRHCAHFDTSSLLWTCTKCQNYRYENRTWKKSITMATITLRMQQSLMLIWDFNTHWQSLEYATFRMQMNLKLWCGIFIALLAYP